jgi:hypothetical protein
MPYFGIPIRNGLPIGLGSVAGFGIAPFSPESLFENGEQGAWYDPSDYSTLFDSSAGTTPVSAPGNGSDVFVGLMLDKSQGLVLGNELSNAATQTLATATGTQSGAGWNVTATGAFAILSQPTVLTSARWYKIRFKWSGNTNARTIRFYVGGSGGTNSIYTAGTATSGDVTFYASTGTQNTNAYFQINDSVNGDTFYLEITSVRELPGNHAFQTSSAKRPELRSRYNLLTYSEEFDNNTAWGLLNASINANTPATTDPLGGNTADEFKGNNATALTDVFQNTTTAAAAYTFLVYAKAGAGGQNFVQLCWGPNQNGTDFANFDLSAESVSGTYTAAAITPVGNGWYRCSITSTLAAAAGGANIILIDSGTATRAQNFTGNGIKSIYIWGADLRPASQATGLIGPTYQRVAAANVYDTAGFLPYLFFDGLSWSMSTNSIDFSAVPTDKMTVWAGVRKLSDALDGMLCELSNNAGSNSGAFYFTAPESGALLSYSFFSRGTVFSGGPQRASTPLATYPAPITNVLAASGNIAGDLNTIRVNGVAGTSATGDQGSGNYGNYPLYIGQRGGSSVPFNGWLTSLIVRGAQSTQSQIEATEAWVNSRTGAY